MFSLMTLFIKNGEYAFLIRLSSMFTISLCKKFQLFQILSDLSIKHLIKPTVHGNDVKLVKFNRSPI